MTSTLTKTTTKKKSTIEAFFNEDSKIEWNNEPVDPIKSIQEFMDIANRPIASEDLIRQEEERQEVIDYFEEKTKLLKEKFDYQE